MASPRGYFDDTFRHSDFLHHELAQRGTEGENCLILAPTSSDKSTVTGIIVSTHLLRRGGRGRVVILADTEDSAQELAERMQTVVPQSKVSVCTSADGTTAAAVHRDLVDSEIVVCTAGKLLESLQEKRMSFTDVTLLVVDKFHLIQRTPQLTETLHVYLAQKHKDSDLAICQVVGVASLKEAAQCFSPEFENTVRQLLSLCALADATSGIKVSSSHLEPLEGPVFAFDVSYQRDHQEPFIDRISHEMNRLEQMVDLRCPFKKWSEEYHSLLQQKREFLATDGNIDDRNQLTVLDMLECYSKALYVYMDARFDDAFALLLTHSFTDPKDKLQEQLAQGLQDVRVDIGDRRKVDNPILIKLEEIILQEILENPDLGAVLVARNEQQASALSAWLTELADMEDMHLSPYLLTLSDNYDSDSERTEAISDGVEIFEYGPYNVLVTTPDIAETVSLQNCSVIIRLQNISHELATRLLRSSPSFRKPLHDSTGFSIFSSPNKTTVQALKQAELEASLKRAVGLLPTGKSLREQVLERQKKIIRVLALKRQHSLTGGQRKKRPNSSEVVLELKCKVCNNLAVTGSDIFMVEEGTQCVVPDASKLDHRISLKPHLPPKHMIGSLVETQRMHCTHCGTEWGALCYWPLKGYEFHVLRCKSFVFELDGAPHTVKRWSDAPFTIRPLSAHPDYPADSSDSGTRSDEECSD